MRILIVDQCSGTKSHPDDYPVIDQKTTKHSGAESLLNRLGIEGIRAQDLYTGKQQKRITEAVHALSRSGHTVERCFISAGFGFVTANQRLPPYDASFNSMSKQEVTERAESFELTQELREFVNTESADIVFLALGSAYYDTIDLHGFLSTVPVETTVVLFNQENAEKPYEHAISVPARTAEGRQFGSTVIGLKGTYLKNFSAAIGNAKNSITPQEAVEFCETDPSAGSQSGIDNYS